MRVLHQQNGARLSSGGILAGGVRGGRHSSGKVWNLQKNRDAAGREDPGVRAAKSSESRKGE